MDIALIALIVVGGAAVTATLVALVRQRAPRVATDPSRLAHLRDRIADQEEQRHHDELVARVAAESDARDVSIAPQRRDPRSTSPERIWGGAF